MIFGNFLEALNSKMVSLFYIAILFILASICDSRVVKIEDISGGFSQTKPRTLHIRNNLQGTIEIKDDPVWSLVVAITGTSTEIENSVEVICKAQSNDKVLDIQVYRTAESESSFVSWELSSGTENVVTANIVLRGPPYTIMPGSNVFHASDKSELKLVGKSIRYKHVIREYDIQPVNAPVDVTLLCYFTCPKACDFGSGTCIPCERGYSFNHFTLNRDSCKDIDECQAGTHNCPVRTSCYNTIGSYECKCKRGFYGVAPACKACKICPVGFFELSPCNSSHNVICKACSPPCQGNLYEVHQCGIAYDRFCEDITENLKKVDKSTIVKARNSMKGSQLFAADILKKYIIMDNRMQSARTTLEFSKNYDREATVTRSGRISIELRLTNVNVLPIFADYDAPKLNENAFFGKFDGFKLITDKFCRFPAPDFYALSHKLLKNHQGLVQTEVCPEKDQDSCPADAKAKELFARRTIRNCDTKECSKWDTDCQNGGAKSALHCDSHVGIASTFGVTDTTFTDKSPWKFHSQDCYDLFLACKGCKEKCRDYSNRKACFDYCGDLCGWFRQYNCDKVPLRCARGDISRFALNPAFNTRNNDLSTRFNCYLKHQMPKKLFDIHFRYVVKGADLEGRWRRIDQISSKSTRAFFNYGKFGVNYRLGKSLTNTVLLTGFKTTNSDKPDRFGIRALHGMRKNDLTLENKKLHFQLLKPFEISTSNWGNSRNCRKLSKWAEIFAKDVSKSLSKTANVTADKIDSPGSEKLYRVNNREPVASVEFSIPNTTSILRQFQSLSTLETFNATVKRNSSHWSIILRGNVTMCPAVLSISVVELTEVTELLRQDAFIICPMTDFHLFVIIPKITPIHKERLFIVYINDGKNTYEARVEKRQEMEVAYEMRKRLKPRVKVVQNLWVKLFPLITLTGCFIVGLLSLMIFARMSRPDKSKSSRIRGYELAAIQLGEADAAQEKVDKEGLMRKRYLIPIVFLVTARVAYSFLLTVSVITMVFYAINKEHLHVMSDFKEFIVTKINESNRISLAMDQFRESEIKFMTDRAAFLECACDYHMGKILRNIRDNMTAIVQLHDVLAYDQVSEALLRTLQKAVTTKGRHSEFAIGNLESIVHWRFRQIESLMSHYGNRVRHNKWFRGAVFLYGAYSKFKNLEFLGNLGVFDFSFFKRLKAKIINQFKELRKQIGLSAIVRRLKKPLYPIANYLLTPVRYMKARVKQAAKKRLKKLKDKILRNIPCYGDVDMEKWEKHADDFEETSKTQCQFAKAHKFAEKIIDGVRNGSARFGIKSARDDSVYSVVDGDKVEEEYEKKQASRLEKLKKVGKFYSPEHTAKAAFKYLKSYSVVLVVAFDVLLIVYRSIKTYKFAFMMAAGYEIFKNHKKVTDESSGANKKHRSLVRRIIDGFAKGAGGMYRVFEKSLKLIFTSLLIPMLIICAAVVALFYLLIAFTYNAMNIQTLDELGAFSLLSARLDLTQNVTKSALNEHANYLNSYDLGMYKETVKAQTEEFRGTIDEFNAEELIRTKRIKAEICDIDRQSGCNVDIDRLMEKLNVEMKPCVLPVIKARMPNDIYNSKAYRLRLKYEMKEYVDAFRSGILNTFYLIIGVIGTIVLIVVASKMIFKFLAAQDMIRFKSKHVYEDIPVKLKREYNASVNK